jgi:hypothetical protein
MLATEWHSSIHMSTSTITEASVPSASRVSSTQPEPMAWGIERMAMIEIAARVHPFRIAAKGAVDVMGSIWNTEQDCVHVTYDKMRPDDVLDVTLPFRIKMKRGHSNISIHEKQKFPSHPQTRSGEPECASSQSIMNSVAGSVLIGAFLTMGVKDVCY